MTEKEIIDGVKNENRKAQKALYDRFAPKMLGICRRYIKDSDDAEDVMIEGMYKVMTKIHQYTGEGNFEGWIRRIMINQSLMELRKKHNFHLSIETSNVEIKSAVTIQNELEAQDILNLLEKLPTGYRTIFNLFVIEGYKHREIAEELGISINTSKSQLILAKKRMRSLVQESQIPDVG